MLNNFFWPFLRIGALFVAAPVFSARTVPLRIRIILVLLITLVIQPALPALPPLDPLSAGGFLLILQQIGIGLVMGFLVQLMFAAMVMAGQVIATTMGLGFASMVDPQSGVQVTMLGQFYVIVATLLFLAVDGHLVLIQMIADTFTLVPVTANPLDISVFNNAVVFAAQIFTSSLLIALPAITGILLVNIAFGVMTKAAPQLNIFALGFPMTIIAGFVLMLLSFSAMLPVVVEFFRNGLAFIGTQFN